MTVPYAEVKSFAQNSAQQTAPTAEALRQTNNRMREILLILSTFTSSVSWSISFLATLFLERLMTPKTTDAAISAAESIDPNIETDSRERNHAHDVRSRQR